MLANLKNSWVRRPAIVVVVITSVPFLMGAALLDVALTIPFTIVDCVKATFRELAPTVRNAWRNAEDDNANV